MKIRDIIATSMGNTLEWLDFGLFIYFAQILGKNFFHTSDPNLSTLAAFSVFFAGYICRPLGGMVFGFFGDTKGRVFALRNSILLMSIATFSVGILPSYETIGILSPILFILIRIIQGISTGGEYCGVIIYLAESAQQKHRGMITSFAGCGAALGFLFASISILFLNYLPIASLHAWGFRLPFLMMGIVGLFIYFYRLNLLETKAFKALYTNNIINQKPLLFAIKYAPRSLLKIFSLTALGSTFYIMLFAYMPKYLAQFSHLAYFNAFIIQSFLLVVMFFLIPLGGKLGDKFGRKNMLIITCIATILFLIPFFYLLNSNNMNLILFALFFTTLLSSFDQGNNLCAFVENCPVDIRYSGIGFAYNLGNAIFGGTAPLIISYLIWTNGPLAPAFYLILCGIISLLGILTLLPAKNTLHSKS